MIAQRGLTRKIVFPLLPLGIATDYYYDYYDIFLFFYIAAALEQAAIVYSVGILYC